jgi:hypothetical protein
MGGRRSSPRTSRLSDTEAVMELDLVVTVETIRDQKGESAVQVPLHSVRAGSVSERTLMGMGGHQRSPTVRRNRRSPAL